MPSFSIADGNSVSYTDTTPNGGVVIDFDQLDNGFSIQINGVDLFVGGPGAAPNEVEFQVPSTSGQTVRFADGDEYETNTPAIWEMANTNGNPVVRLEINPDGTVALYGVKANNGPLEPLELFNGLTVNTPAIAAAWNDTGSNVITIDQEVTGPTNASGDIEDVVCFAAGTEILCPSGPRRIETLAPGDDVVTVDGQATLRWIGQRALGAGALRRNPKLQPVRICAGALGQGLPLRDLIVSRQHRMLVSSKIARRMFGTEDVLIPAIKLTSLPGVYVDDTLSEITYIHLLFDRHEVLVAEGAPSESLFTGPEALKNLEPAARAEVLCLFPEIGDLDYAPSPARLVPANSRQKSLVARHLKNRMPCLSNDVLLAAGTGRSAPKLGA